MIKKRSVNIAGHSTSITLEEPFWDALKSIAATQNISMNTLITAIDKTRGAANLSSALRVYVLQSLRQS